MATGIAGTKQHDSPAGVFVAIWAREVFVVELCFLAGSSGFGSCTSRSRYTGRMAEPATGGLLSVEEYLEFERNSPVKHEYVGGRVYAMAGVSRRHSRISGNIFAVLREAARGGPCRVHQSDMQVRVPDGLFYYPDVVVACGPEPEDPYLEDDPCLVVEVLSPTTASTDRREKLLSYRKLPSLRTYLIVEQEETLVERHFRDENDRWQTDVLEEGRFPVNCPPGAALTVAEIYEGL
ncbi:MAG: Uma2 family endonuclease [Rubrobacteraceae bacterium]